MHVALTCYWASAVLVEDVCGVSCFVLPCLAPANDSNRGCRWELMTEGAVMNCANLDGKIQVLTKLALSPY